MVVILGGEHTVPLGELSSNLNFVIHTLCRSFGQSDPQFVHL